MLVQHHALRGIVTTEQRPDQQAVMLIQFLHGDVGRAMQLDFKKQLAKALAGIEADARAEIADDLSLYMARVFATVGH